MVGEDISSNESKNHSEMGYLPVPEPLPRLLGTYAPDIVKSNRSNRSSKILSCSLRPVGLTDIGDLIDSNDGSGAFEGWLAGLDLA